MGSPILLQNAFGGSFTNLWYCYCKDSVLRKWIGAVGIAAGVVTMASGVVMAYVGFSSARDLVADLSTFIFYPWLVILGIFMWRKTDILPQVKRI